MKRAVRTKLKLLKMTQRDTAKCIFCGGSPTTKEHVFSRWTHKYMPPRQTGKAQSVIAVEHAEKIESTEYKMPGEMRDWQIKCVCARCNNGWMSRLEDAAKPIMKRLIEGRRTRLSEADKRIIAAWAALKVMIVHHRNIHPARRRQLMTKLKPPKGFTVWIGNYTRRRWKPEWLSRPFAVDTQARYAQRRAGRPATPNSHILTQIIKKLLIHVVQCPVESISTRWRFTTPEGADLTGNVVRIWPPTDVSILWPQKALTDRDAEVVADALIRGVKRVAADIRAGRVAPTF
jgi:hypothetical protein